MDNGGLRPEYDRYHKNQLSTFYDSLRKTEKSPVKYLKDPLKDRADITSYLNWPSMRARLQSIDATKKTTNLVNRLYEVSPRGSPKRSPKRNRLLQNRATLDASFKSVTPRSKHMNETLESMHSM
jgi:hypothetical protein